jgi:hypothetical protein
MRLHARPGDYLTAIIMQHQSLGTLGQAIAVSEGCPESTRLYTSGLPPIHTFIPFTLAAQSGMDDACTGSHDLPPNAHLAAPQPYTHLQRGVFADNLDMPESERRLRRRALLRTAREVASGLEYLHSCGVTHGWVSQQIQCDAFINRPKSW